MSGYSYDRRVARTVPLPASFPKTEIGLMTEEEFLHFTNPQDKHHPSDAYNHTLFELNRDEGTYLGTNGEVGSKEMSVTKLMNGIRVTNGDKETVAIIHDGIAYYDHPGMKSHIPTGAFYMGKWTELGIKSYKQVKYLSEIAPLISPVAKRNETRYPLVLQHLLVKGEAMSLRAEKQPTKDAGVTLAILNSEGLMVAQASNEWGATLIMVAHEYRGAGLGKLLLGYWWEHNPSFESGGYTQAGEQTALATWRARVHEFSARGWYTALVKEGKLTIERVKQILAGAGERPVHVQPVSEEPEKKVKPTGDILVFSDEGISFVVYDRAFLEEQDARFIHGFGFFRDDAHIGTFLYKIEYDRPFAAFTTRVALQLAKDNGDKLYNGEGYHDMMEIEGIPGVVIEGDYITVTQNLLPVQAMIRKEKRLRKAADPYDEKYQLLLEMAESKWR